MMPWLTLQSTCESMHTASSVHQHVHFMQILKAVGAPSHGCSQATEAEACPGDQLKNHKEMMRSISNAISAPSMSLIQQMGGFSMQRSMSSSPSTQAAAAGALQWVFLGAPGVGKGTYASRAAKHFNAAHIATGDLIRAEMKAGTKLGQIVRESSASLVLHVTIHARM